MEITTKDYRIGKKIGKGGEAEVFLAEIFDNYILSMTSVRQFVAKRMKNDGLLTFQQELGIKNSIYLLIN